MTENIWTAKSDAINSQLTSFSDLEQDTLKEIGNISLGSSATTLSMILDRRVTITTPTISYKTAQEIKDSFQVPCLIVKVEYLEGLSGNNLLIMSKENAIVIGQLMMMEVIDPSAEITEIQISAVTEAMNQMMGAAATSMADMFDRTVNISAPQVEYKVVDDAISEGTILSGDGFIQIAFRIEVEGCFDSELLQLMPINFARQTVDLLLGNVENDHKVLEETNNNSVSPLLDFNELEQDTLKEVGNISLGSSATTLSLLIGRRVNITTPSISYKTVQEIKESFKAPYVLVKVNYVEGLIGNNLLVISKEDAVIIGQLMMMEEPDSSTEITELHISAVSEAMNQMMGSAATSLSEMFNRLVNISAPEVDYKQISDTVNMEESIDGESGFIQVAFRIEVDNLIDSELLQLMPIKFARQTVDFLLYSFHNEATEHKTAKKTEEYFSLMPKIEDKPLVPRYSEVNAPKELSSRIRISQSFNDDELTLIKNVSLELKGVVGRVRMSLDRLLQLDKGSVIELNSYLGDDVEILINGKKVASGEIVAVGNQYGLRLTKILTN